MDTVGGFDINPANNTIDQASTPISNTPVAPVSLIHLGGNEGISFFTLCLFLLLLLIMWLIYKKYFAHA